VVVRDNLEQLRPLADLVAGLEHVRLKLSLVEPKGEARQRFDALAPDLGAAGSAVLGALARAEELGLGAGYDGFPACLPGALAQYDEHLQTHGICWMNEAFEDRLFPVDRGERAHPADPCDRCALRDRCPGLFAAWAAVRGGSELTPFSGPRPNAILLPAREARPDEQSGDNLEVRLGRERLLARPASRDFSAAELDATLQQRRQVYLDPGASAGVPESVSGLVPLRRVASRGGGVFIPAKRDPFRAEAKRLVQHGSRSTSAWTREPKPGVLFAAARRAPGSRLWPWRISTQLLRASTRRWRFVATITSRIRWWR